MLGMGRKVERVSREEIAQASAMPFSVAAATAKTARTSPEATAKKSYISRLKPSDFTSFFDKFGLLDHYIYNDGSKDMASIHCRNFSVLMSDFEYGIMVHGHSNNDGLAFDYEAICEYCSQTDTPIEQVISDIIAFDFMGGRFPSYPEELQKHRDKKSRQRIFKASKSNPKNSFNCSQ